MITIFYLSAKFYYQNRLKFNILEDQTAFSTIHCELGPTGVAMILERRLEDTTATKTLLTYHGDPIS